MSKLEVESLNVVVMLFGVEEVPGGCQKERPGIPFEKMNLFRWITLCLALLTTSAMPAMARDLQGRLGLGYNSQFAASRDGGGPGVSIKYALSPDLALEGVFALATSSPSQSVSAVKAMKNVFMETNLNFYFMGGMGFCSRAGNSGLEMMGGAGAEFLIPGVDSLGFSMETGVSFDNLSGSYALRTMGVSFLNAGMHFYF